MTDRYAIQCKNTCWIGDHLGADETQKVALRAFQAVEQYTLGLRGRPHFQRTAEFDSVEGKKNSAGLRFKAGALEWFGLRLPILLDPVDRWYVQLVQEGCSPLVPATAPGAVVGLDLGSSTVAVVGASGALLAPLCPGVVQPRKETKRLERAMDYSRRATNPDNLDRRGRAKKSARKWNRSRRYQRLGSGANASVAWPLSASERTANSPTASRRSPSPGGSMCSGMGRAWCNEISTAP
ncbi:MAG TPA: hypothetical protein VMK12_33035 [Anaeromyxobacteraceae bacterium]|nr:hypothetical protein [Anaeromyxobacteraceae bacterium]